MTSGSRRRSAIVQSYNASTFLPDMAVSIESSVIRVHATHQLLMKRLDQIKNWFMGKFSRSLSEGDPAAAFNLFTRLSHETPSSFSAIMVIAGISNRRRMSAFEHQCWCGGVEPVHSSEHDGFTRSGVLNPDAQDTLQSLRIYCFSLTLGCKFGDKICVVPESFDCGSGRIADCTASTNTLVINPSGCSGPKFARGWQASPLSSAQHNTLAAALS